MISLLSRIIAEALCRSQVIGEEDKELYLYGFFVLLSKGLFFLISALFGWLFGVLWESIIFYIMFSVLRSYAGGFHASKESACTCCTTAALFLASLSIWYMEKTENTVIPFCILALCSAAVYLLCPMDSEDKPLTSGELVLYRQKSRAIVIVVGITAISGLCLNLPAILYIASTSMALECVLLALSSMKNNYAGLQ